jgi:hypothetical protein
MINWVMPPQTAVALYIYRVGRSCPARNPFIAKNSQGLLNSTQTRGPPVRPVWPLPDWLQDISPVRPSRDTGLTGGVSLIVLLPNLGANMFCSACRGKSTKKRHQQRDDDKIEEMDMVSIKRRCGNDSTTRT